VIRRALLVALAATIANAQPPVTEQPPELTPEPAPEVRARVAENTDAQAVASVYAETRLKRATIKAVASLADGDTAERAAELARRWDRDLGPTLGAMHEFLSKRLEDAGASLDALERRADTRAGVLPDDPAAALTGLEAFARGAGSAVAQRYLAAFDPRLGSDGLAQLREGVSQTIQTDGSGPSEGLAFTVTLPRSWMQGHARGRGSVLRASSDAGHGLASLVVRVVPTEPGAPAPDPEEVVRRAASDPLGRETATLERAGQTEVFGRPAAWGVLADESTSRWGASRSLTRLHAVVVADAVVKIELAVTDRARSADAILGWPAVRSEFERLTPLFEDLIKRLRVDPARE